LLLAVNGTQDKPAGNPQFFGENMFQFELVVTEKCNLRCSYCYMKNNPLSMGQVIFDQHYEMLPRLMKRYGKTDFVTTFFGGEPLLNWNLMVHAIETIRMNPHNKGFVLPTNGLLLTPEKFKFLKENNVNISLSFDGLWNKSERLDIEHKSRFNEYMILADDRENWLPLMRGCKTMISPGTLISKFSMADNYKWFVNAMGSHYPDFTLVRDNIWNGKTLHLFRTQIKELADQTILFIEDELETMPGIFSLYMLDTIIGEKYGKREFACFAGCGGAGFMPNGWVYPCARFGSNLDSPVANSINKDIYIRLDGINPKTFTKCLNCELRQYCNTGCTYEQVKNGGPVDDVCTLFKMCYEQAYRITETLKNTETFHNTIKQIVKRIGG
jgi:radical SAM protein with 4Fe4S-binding SPASM domain